MKILNWTGLFVAFLWMLSGGALEAAPTAWNLFSGAHGTKGPAYMTLTVQADNDDEIWIVDSAYLTLDNYSFNTSSDNLSASSNLSSGNLTSGTNTSSDNLTSGSNLTSGNVTSGSNLTSDNVTTNSNLTTTVAVDPYAHSANVLDDVLRSQILTVGKTAKVVNFVYQIPQEVLDFDTATMTFTVTFKTSSNVLVGPLSVTDYNVNIITRRETYWDRIPGQQETVVAYAPGNYLTFDYTGAGVLGYLGKATNMGMIEVALDDNVIIAALDLFPTDIPETAVIGSAPRTDYVKTRLVATDSVNAKHRLKITILPTPNKRSSGNALALTAFAYERFVGDTKHINELEVQTTDTSIKLHSAPSIFDGNLLLSQFNLAANVTILNQILNRDASGNSTTGNTLTTTGNTQTTAGNTAINLPKITPIHKPRSTAQTSGWPTNQYLHIHTDNGQNQASVLLNNPAGQSLDFTELDKIHHLKLKTVSDLGQIRSAEGFYYAPLSQPTPWPSGQNQLKISWNNQVITLTRSIVSAAWEVGLVTSNGILGATGEKVLVVQKPGTYERLDFQVDSPFSVIALTDSPVQGTQLSLQKANFVQLSTSTTSTSSTVGSTSSVGSTSAGGGGGGGCLLENTQK
jgi:hypothetical protein